MSRGNDHTLAYLAGFIGAPLMVALLLATMKLGPAAIPFWGIAGLTAWFVSRGPIGEALAARLRGDAGPAELPDEALHELDDLRAQMAELQERVDFAERLLARQGEAARLPEGGA